MPTNINPTVDMKEVKRHKKCHGNRKSQRFRRKWRARGKPPATIEKMIKNRKRIKNRRHRTINRLRTPTIALSNRSTVQLRVQSQPTTTIASDWNKRKVDSRSQQELSTKQKVPTSTLALLDTRIVHHNYRFVLPWIHDSCTSSCIFH